MEILDKNTDETLDNILKRFIKTMFGYDNLCGVENVYPKKKPTESEIDAIINNILLKQIVDFEIDTEDIEQENNEYYKSFYM